ncbi:hypothetical protein [Streptomyces phytophilus]|uniref:hypothetical protein n=1 Tax=Streptomyces phytophilus TaxID=722715 RepID=UPI0015F0B1F0|nr:hypothetical protein [Streptomyces phytophilus]
MTSTDDILNQIDAAIRDSSVGPDAMRSGAAPDDEPPAQLAEPDDFPLAPRYPSRPTDWPAW